MLSSEDVPQTPSSTWAVERPPEFEDPARWTNTQSLSRLGPTCQEVELLQERVPLSAPLASDLAVKSP